jgi:hypothetical protein
MLGHKWESARGTIVEAHSRPASGHSLGAAQYPECRYVIEVRKPTGAVIRGEVTERSVFLHAVGTTIGVEVHAKTGEIRLDPDAVADPVRGMPTMADHVIGPGGQELPVHMEPGEIGNLAQSVRSGDPAARQAAIDRLRELRDHARDRAAQQQAGGGPTSPAAGFSEEPVGFSEEPVGFSSFSEPAGFAPVSQPSPVSPYSPSMSSFGAFDTSGGQGTKDERIARLQQLLDKGILTESEFGAQRQQILGSP